MSGVLNVSGTLSSDLALNSFSCNTLFARSLPPQIVILVEEFINSHGMGNIISSASDTKFSIISTVNLPSNNSNVYLYNSAANQGYHFFYDNSSNTFRLVDYPTGTDIVEADTSVFHVFTNQTIDGNLTTPGNITGGTWQGNVIDEIYGGTGQSSYAVGDLLYASASNTLSKLASNPNPAPYFLTSQNSGIPVWIAGGGGGGVTGEPLTVTNSNPYVSLSLSGDPTAALVNATDIEIEWTGLLSATRGGTGLDTYATGDILYASNSTTLARLAANPLATPYFLTSSNSGVPTWTSAGQALTTSTLCNVTLTLSGTPALALVNSMNIEATWSGVLPVTRGGTGQSTYTNGQVLIGNSSNVSLTKTTLTSGTNMALVNGDGSVTVATSLNPIFTTLTLSNLIEPTVAAIWFSFPQRYIGGSAFGSFNFAFPPVQGNAGDVIVAVTNGSNTAWSPGTQFNSTYSTFSQNVIAYIVFYEEKKETKTYTVYYPNILLANDTSNMIDFGTNGQALPVIAPSRSVGTKMILRNTFSNGVSTDTASGTNTNIFWFSLPTSNINNAWQWFGGITPIMTWDGVGNVSVLESVEANNVIVDNPITETTYNIYGPTSTNSVTLTAHPSTNAYGLVMPSTQGEPFTTLVNDGSGNLSWSYSSGGNVTYSTVTLDGPAPNLFFGNTTANWMTFGSAGVGRPILASRSLGTKIILRDTFSAGTLFDFAIGYQNTPTTSIWFSVPQNTASYQYSWYAGTTEIMSIQQNRKLVAQTINLVNVPANHEFSTLSTLDLECDSTVTISSSTTVTNGNVVLPTTGGTAADLNYYEEFSTTFTVTSGSFAGTPTFPVSIARAGKIITFMANQFTASSTGTSPSYATASLAIPERFRPAYTQRIPISTVNDSNFQLGLVEIQNTTDGGGLIVYFNIDTTTNNINPGTCGHVPFSFQYNL